MNPIEQAYREGIVNSVGGRFSELVWEQSLAKQAAQRYDALLARWQRRAEYLRAQAAHAYADGRDGEAIRLEQAAELYEQVAAEAARLLEDFPDG